MASEMSFILGLPKIKPDPVGSAIKWTKLLRRTKKAPRLLTGQGLLLESLEYSCAAGLGPDGVRGVLGVAGCGTGKTLFLQLAPIVSRSQAPLLILPSNLKDQTTRDAESWHRWYPTQKPFMLSYGKLAHPTGRGILDELGPDLIMLDEGHILGDGVRNKRLWDYVHRHPETRVIIVSGSFTAGYIGPMADAAKLALRDWSPFPIDDGILEQWSSVVDVGGEPDVDALRAFTPLVEWSSKGRWRGDKKRARKALFKRLKACPGIAVTDGPLGVGVSLALHRVEPKRSPEMQLLEDMWELPDGTELVDAIEVARHRRTMRLGFYYRWDPETVNKKFVETRRQWLAKLRALVEYAGYESKYFAEQAVAGGWAPKEAIQLYERWRDVAAEFDPPQTEAVWFDRSLGEGLVTKWLRGMESSERNHAVIWAYSRAVRDYFEDIGYLVHWAGESTTPPNEGPVVVSTAWRRGWNGQHFNRALVLQPPTNARRMEQLISRHHREGQLLDVRFDFLMTEKERLRMTDRAQAAQDITGNPQRWMLGDWV